MELDQLSPQPKKKGNPPYTFDTLPQEVKDMDLTDERLFDYPVLFKKLTPTRMFEEFIRSPLNKEYDFKRHSRKVENPNVRTKQNINGVIEEAPQVETEYTITVYPKHEGKKYPKDQQPLFEH